MKKTILILLSLLTFSIMNAQFDTTINGRLKRLELNNEVIQNNLIRCHKKWTKGLNISGVGFMVTVFGGYTVMNYNNNSNSTTNIGLVITGTGGLLSIIGSLIMIDSHKYIGRSGIGIGSNGITYNFK